MPRPGPAVTHLTDEEVAATADQPVLGRIAKLLLWARLRSDAGVWGTTELVPVTHGGTEVVVTRIDD